MQHTYGIRPKAARLLTVLLASIAYVLLVVINANHTFSSYSPHITLALWTSFGFSELTALMFLVVGALIWLYGRNRYVAMLLFGFSCSMMMVFAPETGSSNNTLLLMIAAIGGGLAIPLLGALFFIFPRDFLSLQPATSLRTKPASSKHHYLTLALRMYIITLITIALFTALLAIPFYFPTRHIPTWLDTLNAITQAVSLITIVVTIIISYRLSSPRERQQLRLFVGGTLITIAPFLILTNLPEAFGGLNSYILDAQFTSIPLILFPIALGYSILRYQILVVDLHIRRAVTWITGIISLSLLTFIVVAVNGAILGTKASVYVISVAGIAVILAPLVWAFSKMLTERLFFSEILYYQRLLEQPTLLNDVSLDQAGAGQLITFAASQAFGTEETCLFILDDDSTHFRISPDLRYDGSDNARLTLVRRMLAPFDPSIKAENHISVMKLPTLIAQQIEKARRPLLWQEVIPEGGRGPTGFARYLNTSSQHNMTDAMFAPVRAQGKMMAILLVGERSDHEPYGGPDFEIVQLIFSRFSPILESARLYTRATRHASMLNNLYRASAISSNAFQSMKEFAAAYARMAADVMAARAEIWLYDKSLNALWFVSTAEQSSLISQDDCLPLEHARDWESWFFEGNAHDNAALIPPCLRQTPAYPFAWLPLYRDQERLGVLVLLYQPPHAFEKEERHVLQMFASQCAAAIDSTRTTIELRAANERQKELDQLKDQFILTASHELRTPLTAVQGYIELIKEYDSTLPAETRAEFIARAGRSCDELTLMVENIMDASRLQVDTENIKPALIPLMASVMHILEILDAVMRRENRTVTLSILPDMLVLADEKRLRQVILNLISNALKYSPPASPIEISARTLAEDRQVVVRVHDYGSGITTADQPRLFERFVRLERDVNSNVRGAGLGLYICKQLTEAMGGHIWVESSGIAGRGSTFIFTLPTIYPTPAQKQSYRISQTSQIERVRH